LVLKHRSAKPS